MTTYTMTRAKALLFTVLLIGVASLVPGKASAKVGTGAAVTVTAEATALRDESVSLTAVRQVLVCVPEAASGSIRVGGAGLTASTGITVAPGSCYSTKLHANEILYGISAGSVGVEVQESTSW